MLFRPPTILSMTLFARANAVSRFVQKPTLSLPLSCGTDQRHCFEIVWTTAYSTPRYSIRTPLPCCVRACEAQPTSLNRSGSARTMPGSKGDLEHRQRCNLLPKGWFLIGSRACAGLAHPGKNRTSPTRRAICPVPVDPPARGINPGRRGSFLLRRLQAGRSEPRIHFQCPLGQL